MNRDHFIGAMAAVLAFVATAIVAIALVTPAPKVHPAPLVPAPIVEVQHEPLPAPVPLPRPKPIVKHINPQLSRPYIEPIGPRCIPDEYSISSC